MDQQASISRNDQLHTGQFNNRTWILAIAMMTMAIVIFAALVGFMTEIPAATITLRYAFAVLVIAPFTLPLLLTSFVTKLAFQREPQPLLRIRQMLADRFASRERTALILLPLLAVPLAMGAFGTLKQAIPLVSDFTWDDQFAEMGRVMLFGTMPWELTHAVFGDALSTFIIDRIYTIWIPIMFITVLGVAIGAGQRLRAQFFITFIASWLVIGSLGAFVLASAGPCYATNIGSATAPYFSDLMARLGEIDANSYPLGAVKWQKVLWDAHSTQDYGFAMGISAMPSMHNAICFLYVLAAWKSGTFMRTTAIAFAVIILIGSVHLGWHYAVDGIAAWILMGILWWGAGRFIDHWCEPGATQPNATALPAS